MKKRIISISPPILSTVASCIALSATACSYENNVLEDYTNDPAKAGFDQDKLNLIDKYVNFRLTEKIAGENSESLGFPSMQICVTKDSKIVYNKAFGKSYLYSQGDTTCTE
jgi:hypothetical protein